MINKNKSNDLQNTTQKAKAWATRTISCLFYQCKSILDIYFTEFGTTLITILPILYQYCYNYGYSDIRNLSAVMKAGGLAL